MGARFLWFRAFNRTEAEQLFDVLSKGDTPNPNSDCTTQQNERTLGISPPHVYAYLGKTLPSFGKFGISLEMAGLVTSVPEGQLSPFDTGGLVEHIHPICEWDEEERREYLGQHSWDHRALETLLDTWPGNDPAEQAAYLDGDRPKMRGPHEALADISGDLPEVELWVENGSWRAWVWELRVPARLPVDTLAFWTCPPDVFPAFLRLGDHKPAIQPQILELVARYVPGGLGQLIAKLRDKQVSI